MNKLSCNLHYICQWFHIWWDWSPRWWAQRTFFSRSGPTEKRVQNIFAILDVSGHLAKYHIFLSEQIIFHTLAQAWRKRVNKYLCFIWRFRPLGKYYIFAEKNNILFINWAWYFALRTSPAEYCTIVSLNFILQVHLDLGVIITFMDTHYSVKI